MKKRTQDDYVRTALRVPPELHAKLHASATAEGRTFNAEILQRLDDSFRRTVDDVEIFKAKEKLDGFMNDKDRELEAAHFGAAGMAHLLSGLLGAFESISKRIDGLPDIPYAEIRAAADKIADSYKGARDASLGTAAETIRKMTDEATKKRRPNLFVADASDSGEAPPRS